MRENIDKGEDEEALSSTRMEGRSQEEDEAEDTGQPTGHVDKPSFHARYRGSFRRSSPFSSPVSLLPYAMLVHKAHPNLLTTFSTVSPCSTVLRNVCMTV